MRAFRVLVTTLVAVGLAASSAAADPPVVTPGAVGGWVDTVVGTPGSPGGAVPVGNTGGGGSAGPVCTYEVLTPAQAVAAGLVVPDGGGAENLPGAEEGSYYMRTCPQSGRAIVWVPTSDAAGPGGVQTLTPAVLAQEARNRLQLPAPAVGISPDGEHDNPPLVGLPTWWWVTNDGTLTQRTAVGPVWAEVTATPYATSWVSSDGERKDCPGLGIAYESWMSETQFGSCRFTYRTAHESETATVQTVWRVTWTGSGRTSGELDPMRVSADHTMPVYERQALVTDG